MEGIGFWLRVGGFDCLMVEYLLGLAVTVAFFNLDTGDLGNLEVLPNFRKELY